MERTKANGLCVWVDVEQIGGEAAELFDHDLLEQSVRYGVIAALEGKGMGLVVHAVKVSPECVGAILEAWRKCKKAD